MRIINSVFVTLFVISCAEQLKTRTSESLFPSASEDAAKQKEGEVSIVGTSDELPQCTKKINGRLFYVMKDEKFFACLKQRWAEVNLKGKLLPLNSLVRSTPIQGGPECAAGGMKFESGLDENHNHKLEDSEVLNTSYACMPTDIKPLKGKLCLVTPDHTKVFGSAGKVDYTFYPDGNIIYNASVGYYGKIDGLNLTLPLYRRSFSGSTKVKSTTLLSSTYLASLRHKDHNFRFLVDDVDDDILFVGMTNHREKTKGDLQLNVDADLVNVEFANLTSTIFGQRVMYKVAKPNYLGESEFVIGSPIYGEANPNINFGGPSQPSTVESSVTIAASDSALVNSSLSVYVNIPHAYKGDVRVSLKAPSGKIVVLRQPSGGSADNVIETYYPAAQFAGEHIKGIWKLIVDDTYPTADSGRLVKWTISEAAYDTESAKCE